MARSGESAAVVGRGSGEPCPDALWRVPAARMKLMLELKHDDGFEYLVPLSAKAVAVLRAVHVLTGRGPLIFPSNQGRHVPHGWRASFSTIMNEWAERGGTPGDRHVIDLMLAHIPEGVSGSEGAYNRAAYLKRRREITEAWGAMVASSIWLKAWICTLPYRPER